MPLIIFAYMYQNNIPLIYAELHHRSEAKMRRVILKGTLICAALYILIGVFGVLTFSDRPELLLRKNILEADYGTNPWMLIGNFAVLFACITAAPLSVLPAKETIEEILEKEIGGALAPLNIFVSLAMVTLCYFLALFLPSVGTAVTLAGSTTNPLIGFVLPVIFYVKIVGFRKRPIRFM